MIQDSANARAQDRLATIEGSLARLGERVIGLMQQYLTGEQVARVVTMPGKAWVPYDADYIQGEFDFEVAAGSTEPRTRRSGGSRRCSWSTPRCRSWRWAWPTRRRCTCTSCRRASGSRTSQPFIMHPGPPPAARPGDRPAPRRSVPTGSHCSRAHPAAVPPMPPGGPGGGPPPAPGARRCHRRAAARVRSPGDADGDDGSGGPPVP